MLDSGDRDLAYHHAEIAEAEGRFSPQPDPTPGVRAFCVQFSNITRRFCAARRRCGALNLTVAYHANERCVRFLLAIDDRDQAPGPSATTFLSSTRLRKCFSARSSRTRSNLVLGILTSQASSFCIDVSSPDLCAVRDRLQLYISAAEIAATHSPAGGSDCRKDIVVMPCRTVFTMRGVVAAYAIRQRGSSMTADALACASQCRQPRTRPKSSSRSRLEGEALTTDSQLTKRLFRRGARIQATLPAFSAERRAAGFAESQDLDCFAKSRSAYRSFAPQRA